MKFISIVRRISITGTFGLLFLTLSLSSQPVLAQQGGTPLAQSPGAPAGSYPLSDIDTVNLFNGRVNVRMPVVTAKGRGGAAGQITFNWDSPANYRIRTDVDPNNGSQLAYVEPGGGGAASMPGLSLGFAQVYGVQGGSTTTYPCSMGSYYTYQKTLTRLYFVEPDGTEHEMRDVQTGGQAISVPICALNGSSRGKVFVSVDGSGATFIADQPVVDYVFAGGDFLIIGPTGYLLMPDGTRYRINDPLQMRDRNGNLLSLTYVNNFPVFQYKIKDSLNRETTHDYSLPCPAPHPGYCQKLAYKGFNGSTRAIWLTGGNPMRLILPNNLEYKFYLNGYGDLTQIDLPTGGSIEYDYGPGIDGPQPDPYAWIQGLQGDIPGTYPLGMGAGIVYRRVTERRLYKEGHLLENRQTFSKPEYYDGSSSTPGNLGYVDKKQYDANGNLLGTERHFFYGAATNSYYVGPIDYPSWKEGREYHSEFYNQSGTLVRQSNMSWEQRAAVPWWGGSADAAPQNDPRLAQSSTVLENGQSTTITNSYDPLVPYNSLTDVYTYDYGGALLQRRNTTYVKTLNGTDYTGLNITNPNLPYMRDLPVQVSIYDGGGERSRMSFEYDNYVADANHATLLPRSGISGLDASFTASYTFRGNVTKVTNYLLTNGNVTGSTSGYLQYDVAGNVVKEIDARGYASTITFTDTFGGPDGNARLNSAPLELSSVGQMSYAFPTLVTNPLSHTTYAQFDYYLGQPVDLEDANGVTNSAAFDDPMDRPTQLIRGANQSTAIKSQTNFSYSDGTRIVTTTVDLASFNDTNALKTQIIYDSLGRVIENRRYETSSNYIATQTQYDALSRAFKTSNPFRPQSEAAVWTIKAFDFLSRIVSVTSPDNAVVSTSYSGNSITATDPAGKARKTVINALGRVTSVYEDPNGVNHQTNYGYDGLGNLTTVTQGAQTRTFVYDSLKRLTSATIPESGSTTYQYDANGNLTQKTDARGVIATYVYDALNRNTSIDYSDATPDVFRQYDLAVKGIGRLNQTWQSGAKTSATYIDSYDALGRPLVQRQRYETSGVWSSSYQTSRTYNQAGFVTSQTYPSGHTVNYTFDLAGRTSGFTGNLGDGTTRNYATNINYSPFGGTSWEQLGTSTPLYHKSFYNIRGQIFDTRLSSVNDMWDWNRGRLILYYSSNHIWGQSGADNNGNVRFAETWIPPENATLDQADTLIEDIYTYDSLNRLTSVAEQQTNVAGGWGTWQQQFRQQYTYDQYGNRTIDAAQTWGLGINNKQFTVSTASNRLGVPIGQTGSMVYDNAGNLTTDSYTGIGSRAYDAENRMTTAADVTGQTSRYTYDADGRRVRRQVASSQEVWQIYGIEGELLAEYSPAAATSAPEKEYGYRNGQLLITATGRFNVAAAAAGAVATASSTATGSGFSTTGAINGNYRGPWGNSLEGWNDNTPNSVPDWIEVAFAGSKTIDEINVFSLHDNYTVENTPTETQTFSLYGLQSFNVQYWNGSSWVTVPGGSVTGNNKVWRKFTFSAITTSKIRVFINAVPDAWSRVVEIQAFGTSASGEKIQWLVADHLGTPRMVADLTGSLANIRRHDYLPFGEEVFTGRSAAKGYTIGDGVRQQFTQKERDIETGLDYFGARYFVSTQGRFTSPDPLLASGRVENPQTWNRYAYTLNNPLRYFDPNGLFEWDASLGGSLDDRNVSDKIRKKREEIRAAISKANEALNSGKLSTTQKANLARALNSYGAEGTANGVKIAVGSVSSGTVANTKLGQQQLLYDQATGITRANVMVTFKDGEKTTAESFAHEGSHVADRQELVAAFAQSSAGDPKADWLHMPENLTIRQAESRAYRVSAAVAQGLGTSLTLGGYEIWNSGWSEADRSANMQKGIKNMLTKSPVYKDKLNDRMMKEQP